MYLDILKLQKQKGGQGEGRLLAMDKDNADHVYPFARGGASVPYPARLGLFTSRLKKATLASLASEMGLTVNQPPGAVSFVSLQPRERLRYVLISHRLGP